MPTAKQIPDNIHEYPEAPKKFNCRECGTKIGGHNKYCHDGMCDDCFFETYFPEECRKTPGGKNENA